LAHQAAIAAAAAAQSSGQQGAPAVAASVVTTVGSMAQAIQPMSAAAAVGNVSQPGMVAQQPLPPNQHKMPPQARQDKGQELSTPGDGALRDALAAAALKASLAARASKHSAQTHGQGSSSGQGQVPQAGALGEQQKAKVPRAPPAMLQPPAATLARFMAMEMQMPLKQEEAAAAMAALESIKGIPVFTAEGDGKSEGRKPSDFGADTKLTWGKMIYKGNGCNFSVGCQTPDGLQKLGPMQFLKLANNFSSRPRNVIFLCCNLQSVADFEKDHAIPADPVPQDNKRKRGEPGQVDVSEKSYEKPQCGPGATREWPEDDMHVCEEDHRCCDVAKFYGVDLELLVEKNKARYKSLNKVIRLKAGTVLLLPLPGDTKESIAVAEAQEKERLKKKRRLELQQLSKEKGGEGAVAKDKKRMSAGKSRAKADQRSAAPATAEEPEESVETILARASDADTPEVCGARQVSITDRLPFNVTRPEIEPQKWDDYRDSTLAAKSFADLGVQLCFMEAQILPAALRAEWVEKHRAAFPAKCAEAKDVKAIGQCMHELFVDAIDWAAVDKHWDMIEDEEATASMQDDDIEAPAQLAKSLSYESAGLNVYVEDEKPEKGKRCGRLYIGRHPKTGAPIWLVEAAVGDGAGAASDKQQLRASVFAAQGKGSGGKHATSHFLRRIFLMEGGQDASSKQAGAPLCLLDWLVAEGHISKAAAEVGQAGSLTALAAIPSTVEEKLAQAMARMLQLVDRIPFAAVKNKKAELWVEYSHRIVVASTPGMLAVELKWFSNQLVTKVMQAPWLSNAKGGWEVSCDRVSALKDFYMVLMELEDDAINWKAIDSRWAIENSRGAQEAEGAAQPASGTDKVNRSHKKKERREKQEGPCPLPLATNSAAARLPEGWGIEVKSATVWRPEECYVVFRAPDGYFLHSIDDVLKYYQKHKMLQQFSESIRKGFVAAQQEAKTIHSKHMQRIAKFLFPMPEIPAKFLDDAKDTDISRETRMQERTARLAEKVANSANSPRPLATTPKSMQSPVATTWSAAGTPPATAAAAAGGIGGVGAAAASTATQGATSCPASSAATSCPASSAATQAATAAPESAAVAASAPRPAPHDASVASCSTSDDASGAPLAPTASAGASDETHEKAEAAAVTSVVCPGGSAAAIAPTSAGVGTGAAAASPAASCTRQHDGMVDGLAGKPDDAGSKAAEDGAVPIGRKRVRDEEVDGGGWG